MKKMSLIKKMNKDLKKAEKELTKAINLKDQKEIDFWKYIIDYIKSKLTDQHEWVGY